MELVHLPHVAVPFLNALHRQEPPSEESTQSFAMLVVSARRWLDFQSGYSLDDTEANELENLKVFWDEVERAADAPSPKLDALVPPLYEALDTMDRIRRRREQAGFSAHLPLNDLLLAGAAVLTGRATERAISDRLPLAEQWLENVASMLRGSTPRLQPEVCAAVVSGIDEMRRALAEMGNPATRETGVHRVHAADEVVSQFLDWDRRDHERLAERQSTYDIPLIGPDLELAMKGARHVERQTWTQPVQALLDLVLPRLENWWGEQRYVVLMPAEVRVSLLNEVDMALFELRSAVTGLVDTHHDVETVLARYEAALTRASAAFRAIREARWDPSPLEGSAANAYFEAIEGVMGGTVPDVALLGLMHERPLPDNHLDVRDELLAYLKEGDTDALLRACALLIERARPSSIALSCPSCGGTLSDDGRCRKCGDKPISIVAWEA